MFALVATVGCGSEPLVSDQKLVTCEGSTLLAPSPDYAAKGPWAVGAKTVQLAGFRTEVWYPAAAGSEASASPVQYDVREHLPPADRAKIPDADSPLQTCDCFRDLPLDVSHGPYPLVLFVHGTASFRTQSLTQMTHWASRGFIVVAADHPGIDLASVLSGMFASHQDADVKLLLDALAKPEGDVSFLADHVAHDRLALSGHSAGGGAIQGFSDYPGVRVQIPLAAGGSVKGSALKSTLVMSGKVDGIVPYSSVKQAYDGSPAKKRFVGLSAAGHLAFTDICTIGADQGGLLKIAQSHGIAVPDLLVTLGSDGCEPGRLSADKAASIIDYATSATLEESLSCDTASAASLDGIAARYSYVSEYAAQLE